MFTCLSRITLYQLRPLWISFNWALLSLSKLQLEDCLCKVDIMVEHQKQLELLRLYKGQSRILAFFHVTCKYTCIFFLRTVVVIAEVFYTFLEVELFIGNIWRPSFMLF